MLRNRCKKDRVRRRTKKTTRKCRHKQKYTRHSAWPLSTLKKGDENELESKLRLEKVVTSKQLRLAVETEEKRRVILENGGATKLLMLAMEMDEERKTRLEKMVSTKQLS